MPPSKANPMSAAEPTSPALHLLPGDEQFQARSTASISLPLASASSGGETNMRFIVMGTKLQSQDQLDGSRNAHFQLCGPHGTVPCAPMPIAHKLSHTATSYWTKKPQEQPQRNCLYPDRSSLPFISSKWAFLQHHQYRIEKESLDVVLPSISLRGTGDMKKGEPETSSDWRQRNYKDLLL